jgi:serine/threonine protein kinase
MLTPKGQVKLLDLGLARLMETSAAGDGSLTPSGALLGTLDYLAPEQALDPAKADARSDLYSLGCTLYYLLAGRPPFAHCPGPKKLSAHERDLPPPLGRPDVPAGVVTVLNTLLAKDPDKRYPSAAALLQALAGRWCLHVYVRAAAGFGLPPSARLQRWY